VDQLDIVLELVAFTQEDNIVIPELGQNIFLRGLPVGSQILDELNLLLGGDVSLRADLGGRNPEEEKEYR
jgi:hypothetical protein